MINPNGSDTLGPGFPAWEASERAVVALREMRAELRKEGVAPDVVEDWVRFVVERSAETE